MRGIHQETLSTLAWDITTPPFFSRSLRPAERWSRSRGNFVQVKAQNGEGVAITANYPITECRPVSSSVRKIYRRLARAGIIDRISIWNASWGERGSGWAVPIDTLCKSTNNYRPFRRSCSWDLEAILSKREEDHAETYHRHLLVSMSAKQNMPELSFRKRRKWLNRKTLLKRIIAHKAGLARDSLGCIRHALHHRPAAPFRIDSPL